MPKRSVDGWAVPSDQALESVLDLSGLTHSQAVILKIAAYHIRTHHSFPTLREIANYMGTPYASAAESYIRALAKKNKITRSPSSRTWSLVGVTINLSRETIGGNGTGEPDAKRDGVQTQTEDRGAA